MKRKFGKSWKLRLGKIKTGNSWCIRRICVLPFFRNDLDLDLDLDLYSLLSTSIFFQKKKSFMNIATKYAFS